MRVVSAVVLLFFSSLAQAAGAIPARVWFHPHSVQPKAVVVLVHGLNTRPEKMDSFASFLTDAGAEVLRVALTGHRGDYDSFTRVTRSDWLEDAKTAYSEARARADALHVPLYLLAFSLGSLVNLDMLLSAPVSEKSRAHFDRMVLLAPPLKIRVPDFVIRVAYAILGGSLALFSLNPEEYRVNRGTPIQGYAALLAIKDSIERVGLGELKVPALVVMDPKDELVQSLEIPKLIEDAGLHGFWAPYWITHSGCPYPQMRHHLLLDETTVGSQEWAGLRDAILKHFNFYTLKR